MSTEDQCYSIPNQEAAISAYAKERGYEIVPRKYADSAESGLTLKRRKGLQELLSDVIKGSARYKRIVVLDVSRWGRFQDPDEAAHYEFVCRKRGIEVEYCAEEFRFCDSMADYTAKVLKRMLAAEYSRNSAFAASITIAELSNVVSGWFAGRLWFSSNGCEYRWPI